MDIFAPHLGVVITVSQLLVLFAILVVALGGKSAPSKQAVKASPNTDKSSQTQDKS